MSHFATVRGEPSVEFFPTLGMGRTVDGVKFHAFNTLQIWQRGLYGLLRWHKDCAVDVLEVEEYVLNSQGVVALDGSVVCELSLCCFGAEGR